MEFCSSLKYEEFFLFEDCYGDKYVDNYVLIHQDIPLFQRVTDFFSLPLDWEK